MSQRCPICKRRFEQSAATPFCSARCRYLDLGKWLADDYRLPVPISERDLDELEQAIESKQDASNARATRP